MAIAPTSGKEPSSVRSDMSGDSATPTDVRLLIPPGAELGNAAIAGLDP